MFCDAERLRSSQPETPIWGRRGMSIHQLCVNNSVYHLHGPAGGASYWLHHVQVSLHVLTVLLFMMHIVYWIVSVRGIITHNLTGYRIPVCKWCMWFGHIQRMSEEFVKKYMWMKLKVIVGKEGHSDGRIGLKSTWVKEVLVEGWDGTSKEGAFG